MQPGELDKGRQMESYEKWVEAKQFEAYRESQKEFYRHVSKQFEPQNPKPYQKRKVNGQMTFDDVDDKYAQAISKERKAYAEKFRQHKQENREWQLKTKNVSNQEIEEFFWDKLVQLGWKAHEDERGNSEFVLQCEDCDGIVTRVYFKYMTLEMLNKMAHPKLIQKGYQEHKTICEAIPKAIPKRKTT